MSRITIAVYILWFCNVLAPLTNWQTLDAQPRRALWVWKPTTNNWWDGQPSWERMVDNYENSADLVIDFCRNKSINVIYLYIGAYEWESGYFDGSLRGGEPGLYNESGYYHIITNARRWDITVFGLFYLYDDPNDSRIDSEGPTAISNIIKAVVGYNDRHSDAMIAGIESDQEPWNTARYPGLLDVFQCGMDYIAALTNWGACHLVFDADVKPSWTIGDPDITWNSQTKPMYQHCLDILDGIALMDYYDSEPELFPRAASNIYYAESIGGRSVSIGVETGWQNVGNANTFNDEIAAESPANRFNYMEGELAALLPNFIDSNSFNRIAIHDFAQYFLHWMGEGADPFLAANPSPPWTSNFVDLTVDTSLQAGYPKSTCPAWPMVTITTGPAVSITTNAPFQIEFTADAKHGF
ncbi:MAG TPA: hypothetical protein VKS21_10610, partial [Spirochaetota bacterium]|nr:hypothetical protein [Spirochaetota bacterium]